MKILIDTNILISAVLFLQSKPAKVLFNVSAYHEMVLCEQNIYEFFEVIKRKAPHKLIAANVDIIITGDKDFLSLDIAHPKCITAAQFLERI